METGEPSHAGWSPVRSLWWSWTATADGIVTISTEGSSVFDTKLGVYTGDTVNALTAVASNDNITDSSFSLNELGFLIFNPGNLKSRVYFTVSSGTTYQVAVGANSLSDIGDIKLTISLD